MKVVFKDGKLVVDEADLVRNKLRESALYFFGLNAGHVGVGQLYLEFSVGYAIYKR